MFTTERTVFLRHAGAALPAADLPNGKWREEQNGSAFEFVGIRPCWFRGNGHAQSDLGCRLQLFVFCCG